MWEIFGEVVGLGWGELNVKNGGLFLRNTVCIILIAETILRLVRILLHCCRQF